MGLNLNAKRRVSLNGFAVGWDDCYLFVKAMNRDAAAELQDKIEVLREANDIKGLDALLVEFLKSNILNGVVMNTLDDGTQEPYEFKHDEAGEVIEYFNTAWQLEVLEVATGADRLKLKTI